MTDEPFATHPKFQALPPARQASVRRAYAECMENAKYLGATPPGVPKIVLDMLCGSGFEPQEPEPDPLAARRKQARQDNRLWDVTATALRATIVKVGARRIYVSTEIRRTLEERWKDVKTTPIRSGIPCPEGAFVNYDGAHLFEDTELADGDFWFEKEAEADQPVILEEAHP